MQTVSVRHNMEMAHRLFETEGKCENIHGHSWQVTLTLGGQVRSRTGMLEGLDFALIKSTFRKYLDGTYDHRLLLNMDDPFAGHMQVGDDALEHVELPGLQRFVGNPTTERIAYTIGSWGRLTFPMCNFVKVDVWETAVNNATWEGRYGPETARALYLDTR